METDTFVHKSEESFLDSMKLLHDTKGEIYLTLILSFFYRCFFIFVSYLLSIYYIEVWELDDFTAGILTALNVFRALSIFIIGGIVDYIGIRDTYFITSVVGILVFLCLAFIQNLIFQVFLIAGALSILETIIFSALKAAILLTTDPKTMSLGFSLQNSSFYLSTIVCGFLSKLIFALQGVNFESFQTIFYFIIGCFLIAFILSCYSKLDKNWITSNKIIETNPFKILKEVMNEKRFWRLILVQSAAAFVVGTILQVGFVLPIYMDRELGDNTSYGLILAVFSILIIILSPLLTGLVNYFSIYNCMILGGIIVGLAPGIFIVANNFWTISIYIFITAVGASIFEPRLFDYCALVAISGKEGIYFTTLGFAYSLSFVVTGIIGGKFLEVYCPEDGDRECWSMW